MECEESHVMEKLIILTQKVLQDNEGAGVSAGHNFKFRL